MDIQCLTFVHIRWIGRCAERILATDPEVGHMAAVQQAFDLLGVWPLTDPLVVADAFLGREFVVLPG
ncbi:hypothetical protein HQN59_09370 [Schlegelella sp. ID0723]|uniref:Uncharacterized protein n=1 Tax=Piscinibacter koreensis TaxID=2742824 RepID=A0A7Y6TWE5_9BURK|nr:hypothetical protein [Schlegelella koreensis]